MSTSAGQGQSGRWFDVIALILFIVIGLGGLASIFFSSSKGLASTEFVISFVGLLFSIIPLSPGLSKRWKQMFQGKSEILLRMVTTVLLVSIIVLQSLILIIETRRPLTSPKGQPEAAKVQPTPTPTPTLTPTPSPPSVLITAPTDGSQVSMLTTVQGTAQNIPKDEELWLFIVPSNQASYFPQPGPIKILSGKWSIGAHFGVASDVGLKFTLIPVLINQNDQEAHNAIKKYFQQPGPVYQGIQQTSGMQLMSPEITVVRV